ncbi:hypothetical protein [Marinomonas transparens]|uniref:Lipoprotein n=1 Tax=Marinomonas transparens TaxID=2795388 RepID=A0A934JU23_9GAMM|nr:hypothetical protein [Marinomonas transparens]MBJ7539969.1 hypothetical protein [Marinomonas transparens]
MCKYIYILIASSLMAGCGGSDSEPSNQSASNSTSQSSLSATSQSNSESTQATLPISATQTASATSELESSTSFTFSNQQSISLDLQLSSFAGERVMVNVCLPQSSHSPSYDLNSVNMDYQQCLYKTTITNGELITNLTLPKHNEHLMLELRPYSNLATATTFHWQSSDGSYWFIR